MVAVIPINDQATHINGGCNGSMVGNPGDPMYSLTVTDKHAVALYENHGQDSRLTGPLDVGPTVAAKFGTGGNNTPLVTAYDHKDLGRRNAAFEGQAPTLKSRMGTGGCNVPLITTYRKSRRAQSADDAGGAGETVRRVVAPTLTAYNMDSRSPQSEEQQRMVASVLEARMGAISVDTSHAETWVEDDTANTVNCFDVGDVRTTSVVMAHGQANAEVVMDGCPTLNCNHEQPILFHQRMRVRRLTPLECERLQGFPDGWTDTPGASDSARYKALGNSLAIPTAEYVIEGITVTMGKGVNP